MNKKIVIGGVALAVIALAVYWLATANKEEDFLAKYNLNDKSDAEIIEYLDSLDQDRPLAFTASVTAEKLILSDDSVDIERDLEDEFYLSFAPYAENTHPCYNHSLATCQGELVNEVFQVTVTQDDGTVIFAGERTSYHNGFIGIWLPRDIEGVIEVQYGDLQGSEVFETASDSPTCLTTLILE